MTLGGRWLRALAPGPFERARLRLAAYYVAILLVILVAFDIGILTLLGRSLEANLEDDLQHKAEQAAAAIVNIDGDAFFDRSALATPEWSEISMYATTNNGTVIQAANSLAQTVLPARASLSSGLNGRAELTQVRSGRQRFLVYTQPIYRRNAASGSRPVVVGVVQVARSSSTADDAVTELGSVIGAASGFALLLAFLSGLWLADKVLQPIRLALLEQKEFVSDASHELRTPVTVIRAAAESILRGREPVSARVRELADDIVTETGQLGSLVDGLSELARADSRGGVQLDLVEVRPLLAGIAEAGSLLAASRGSKLVASVDVDGSLAADAVRLRQLFAILLDNATKFAPAGTAVELLADRAGGWVRVRVVDHGPGIPRDELPRIFQRFFRGRAERQNEGSGLGLSIAQWIVAEHSGRITVLSSEGHGAEFAVELPLKPASAAAARPEG